VVSEGHTWRGRHVLVTGAGGFIGSHVVERLLGEGARVRALVRYNSRNDYGWLETIEVPADGALEVFRGDLANPEAMHRAVDTCETVFHLGALIPIPYSYVHPREFVTANVVGTLNVLEAARRAGGIRVVHTSTSEVYGTAQRVPIDEGHPLRAQSPYAATKVGADQLALSFQRSFDLPVVVVRPFNTYGPKQSARAVIPTIISQALAGEVVRLGNLEATRDFLYVEDTAAGMLRCAEVAGAEGEVINLGTGSEVSVGELAVRIFELMGKEPQVVAADERLRPPNSEVGRLLAGVEKASSLLGWRPEITLDEGLSRTIDWIVRSPGIYKPIYNV